MSRDWLIGLFVCCLALLPGCRSERPVRLGDTDRYYQGIATQIEYPALECDPGGANRFQPRPNTLRSTEPLSDWPLTLEEAIRIALTESDVIRGVGGRVASPPSTLSTVYDVAIQETDPRFGVESALSAFDAQFASNLIFMRNERTFNNLFFGGGVSGLRQNTGDFQAELSKTAATGTQFAFRNITRFDENNSPINRFHNTWDTLFEAEVRQPLLQGSGLALNRIAGPQATPGNYNGILLARVDTDISLADFESSVIDLLSDVELAYWQLYFAYRDLDAKIAARDAALQIWRTVHAQFQVQTADREQEALARQEYFAAQAMVENAVSGTATTGLVITTSAGVHTVERRLRLLLGLPANDGRLIRPADEPPTAEIVFDWETSLIASLTNRVELRRQKWTIKRREMELVAARNFLRVKLDFVGQFRRRGFGDDLVGRTREENGSAFGDLFTGDLQEWQLGLQLNTPIGNRIGHAAVRNAELQLARDRAIYRKKEQGVSSELTAAFAELDRAYAVSRTQFNRRFAAHDRLAAVRDKYEVREVLLESLREAQGLATETDSHYYRSLTEYSLALMNLHKAQGTLLAYYQVHLDEGPWSASAHDWAASQSHRFGPRRLNYCFEVPCPISRGEAVIMTNDE